MDPAERHQRLRALFHGALPLAPDARAAFLTAECAGDAPLREDVEDLLSRAEDPLPIDAPEWRGVLGLVPGTPESNEPPRLPERIGEYRILRLLGRGGMGEVYEAEQPHPHRRVAIKVIRRGSDDPQVVRRFQREAELLGSLNHPGIAKIHVAGRAEIVIPGSPPATCPYLAMEFVAGDSLRQWVERRRPPLRDRIELIVHVAEAIHHAHGQGVVHRDLKPENIIVEEGPDGALTPKILDFGIARTVGTGLGVTFHTMEGQILGTLAYMSPEQASGQQDRVDGGADVYALGVILFECATGRLPFDLEAKDLAETVRIIRDEDPARLSHFDHALRGDLEIIVAKALEKETSRRYRTARALADDLRSFLRHEAIEAHAPSRVYRFRKFFRRHRTLVLAVSGVIVALSVGLAISLRSLSQEERARAQAQSISGFLLEEMIEAADPARGGHDQKLIDVLVLSAGRIGERFRGHPETETVVRRQLAAVFLRLGRIPEAVEQARASTDLARRHLGADHAETLESEHVLLRAWGNAGDWVSVERLVSDHVERTRSRYGDDDPRTWRARLRHADSLQVAATYDEADAMLRRLLARWRTVEGFDADIEETLNLLGTSLIARATKNELYGDGGSTFKAIAVEAEATLREALARTTKRLGRSHPGTLVAMNDYAVILWRTGRYADAEALFDETLTLLDSGMPADFWRRGQVQANRARVYASTGRPALAADQLADAASRLTAALGEAHFLSRQCLRDRVLALCDAGDPDEAERVLAEIIRVGVEPKSYWVDPPEAAIRKARSPAPK